MNQHVENVKIRLGMFLFGKFRRVVLQDICVPIFYNLFMVVWGSKLHETPLFGCEMCV